MIQRPNGRVLARRIGIEAQDHLLNVPLKDPRVLGGESGALRGHDIFNSTHETGNQVQLSLTYNRRLRFEQYPLGLVQTEKHLALRENGRLRRIDVFGRLLVAGKHAPTEPHNPPLLVTNRKHEPATEPVVKVAGLL